MNTAVKVISMPSATSMCNRLVQDYADSPITLIPRMFLPFYTDRWARRQDIIFLEALDQEQQYMGFLFAHTLGDQPWRTLLADPIWLSPVGFCILLKQKISSSYKKKRSKEPDSATTLVKAETLLPFPNHLTQEKRLIKLEYITTSPNHRGKRIATKLMQALDVEAKEKGISLISSTIAPHNAGSISAHKRSGYQVYSQNQGALRTLRNLKSGSKT